MFRVLVCGGRDFHTRSVVFSHLDGILARHKEIVVIQGGASGADFEASMWAGQRQQECVCFKADWKKYGKAAGMIRNQKMLDESDPDLVLAFPGGRGTRNMTRIAEEAGVRVYRVGPHSDPAAMIIDAARVERPPTTDEGGAMPKGSAAFDSHQRAVEERRSAGGDFPRADFFKLEDGEQALVRFLEQGDDLTYAIVHRIKVPNLQWPQDMVCLDQNDDGTPCPACQSSDKKIRARSTKGFVNIIWRGNQAMQQHNDQLRQMNQTQGTNHRLYKLAPTYKRDENGWLEKDDNGVKTVIGYGDGIWLWKCTKSVFEELLKMDRMFKGRMTREMVVRRQGAGLKDTKYLIEPVDPTVAQPMGPEDQALYPNRFDVDALTKPPTYEEMQAAISGQPTGNAGPQPTFDRGAAAFGAPPIPGAGAPGEAFGGQPPMRSSAFDSAGS